MLSTEVNGGKANNTARAQLTRLILRLEQEEKKDLCGAGSLAPEPVPFESAQQPHEQSSWHAIAYGAVSLSILLLLLLSLLALLWMWHDFPPGDPPEWQPVVALAEVAREKGEFYDARGLYSQAGRFAAWSDDWVGLLAAACGFDKLEKKPTRYSTRDSLLVRAVTAAERKQSRAGMTAVAKAFTYLEKHESAAMALSRMRNNWPLERGSAADLALPDCWTETPDHRIDLTGE